MPIAPKHTSWRNHLDIGFRITPFLWELEWFTAQGWAREYGYGENRSEHSFVLNLGPIRIYGSWPRRQV